MKRIVVALILASIAVMGLSLQASAQTIPTVKGITAFSAQANYMSLAGYLRWQYFVQNKTWISPQEAQNLVNQGQ
ncbi:MAG TPA: hypothetical protein VGM23_07880 [Armatimonadota bacterium]|jgi:hypothetical protein